MPAGTEYAKNLNKDLNKVKTPAFYDANLDEWLMASANVVQTEGGLFIFQKGTDLGRAKTDAVISAELPAGTKKIGSVDATLTGSSVESAVTMQNAATANGNGTSINTSGKGSLVLTVIGAFDATVIFESTADEGTTWRSHSAVNLATSVTSPNALAQGTFRLNVAGVDLVRTRISGYVSGAITVVGKASATIAPDTNRVATGAFSAIETIANAVSVPSGVITSLSVSINALGAQEIYLLLSIDKQPWTMTSSVGPWTLTGSITGTSHYPNTAAAKTTTHTTAFPFIALKTQELSASSWGGETVSTIEKAKAFSWRSVNNFAVSVNQTSGDIATVTLKILRVYGGA